MADSFLSRWAKRKAEVQAESAKTTETKLDAAQDLPTSSALAQNAEQTKASSDNPDSIKDEAYSGPTLEDVKNLTKDSDFSAFVAKDIDPTVQQAAMKKLFSDPHFNVMDGLDIYIDDYSKPDPLPAGMLQKMAQSAMLGLFKSTIQEGIDDVTQQGTKEAMHQDTQHRSSIDQKAPTESTLAKSIDSQKIDSQRVDTPEQEQQNIQIKNNQT